MLPPPIISFFQGHHPLIVPSQNNKSILPPNLQPLPFYHIKKEFLLWCQNWDPVISPSLILSFFIRTKMVRAYTFFLRPFALTHYIYTTLPFHPLKVFSPAALYLENPLILPSQRVFACRAEFPKPSRSALPKKNATLPRVLNIGRPKSDIFCRYFF